MYKGEIQYGDAHHHNYLQPQPAARTADRQSSSDRTGPVVLPEIAAMYVCSHARLALRNTLAITAVTVPILYLRVIRFNTHCNRVLRACKHTVLELHASKHTVAECCTPQNTPWLSEKREEPWPMPRPRGGKLEECAAAAVGLIPRLAGGGSSFNSSTPVALYAV